MTELRKPSKDLTINPPSYAQVVDEVASLRLQLKEAQELNEEIKRKKRERKERKERRERTPMRASSERFLPSTIRQRTSSSNTIPDYEESGSSPSKTMDQE